ncbi:MAG: hypothetical protein H7343_04900 [Undibacterium sp.]|nr:hypothetical protein [Opitutaceae bacterium]
MAHAFRYLIIVLALALASAALSAAVPRSEPISVRFTVFSAHPIDGLGYRSATGATLPLKFFPASRSARSAYNGPSPLNFVDAASGAVVAEAEVPAAIREPLLLFTTLPAPDARGLRYQVAVIDDSVTKLPPGHLAVVNLSGLKLTGTMDKTTLTLDAGLNAPVPFAAGASLRLYAMSRGTRVQSFSDTLKTARSARLLILLLPPARKGALEVQSRALSDEPQPAVPVSGIK